MEITIQPVGNKVETITLEELKIYPYKVIILLFYFCNNKNKNIEKELILKELFKRLPQKYLLEILEEGKVFGHKWSETMIEIEKYI